jgi:hypothetical protein
VNLPLVFGWALDNCLNVGQLENLSILRADPEPLRLWRAALGQDFSDDEPLTLPSERCRSLGVGVPGMAFDNVSHMNNATLE